MDGEEVEVVVVVEGEGLIRIRVVRRRRSRLVGSGWVGEEELRMDLRRPLWIVLRGLGLVEVVQVVMVMVMVEVEMEMEGGVRAGKVGD